MVVLEPGGAHGQQARGINLRGHVGQLPLRALEVADGVAELLALLAVLERAVVGPGGHAQPKRGNRNAPAIEHAHGIHKALAQFTQQIFRGNLAVFEDQLGGITGAQAELVFFFSGAETRRAFFYEESRKPARAAGLIRYGHHDHHVGIAARGDKRFGAVQQPAVALPNGGAARSTSIRSAAGLGERPGAKMLSAGQLGQVAELLLLRAGKVYVIAAQRRMGGHDDAHRAIHARKLLDGQYVFDVAQPSAAQLFGKDAAHQPHSAQLAQYRLRKARRLVPLHHMRRNLSGGKVAHRGLQLQLLVSQLEVHTHSISIGIWGIEALRPTRIGL